MATRLENLKWKLYMIKKSYLVTWGIKHGLIRLYEEKLIEELRHVYYGGIPGSILLLCNKMCNGVCYDRALLISLGFEDDDFQLIYADIDGIALNPEIIDEVSQCPERSPHYSRHCIAERKKKDGTTWIYDTSHGLVFEKSLYHRIERPRITKINSKEATLEYFEYQSIKNSNIEADKYMIPLILPNIERVAAENQDFYTEVLKREIEIFKQEIGYDQICKEIEIDMIAKGFKGARHI